MDLVKIRLRISPAQFRKLQKGLPIQLSHSALWAESHHLFVHPATAKRIARAKDKERGVRIQLSSHELERSGEGLLDFFKSAGRFLKDKVIDTPFYQQNIKPVVKTLVKTGVEAAAPLLAQRLGPLAPDAERILQKGADYVGQKSNAFGLHEYQPPWMQAAVMLPPPGDLAPVVVHHVHHHAKGHAAPPKKKRATKRGGSFRPA
jgi:hypothetical protein